MGPRDSDPDAPTVGLEPTVTMPESAGNDRPSLRSIANGRYVIVRALGQGGQKNAYLARDTRLERMVVISLQAGPATG